MFSDTRVSCPRCGTQTDTVPVRSEVHHCEIFARACGTCLTRFTYDGKTWPFVRQLPPPLPLRAAA